jgi:hypothetical protein
MATVDDVKKKVQRILADELGSVEIDRDGDFVVKHESAVTFIQCRPRNNKPDADIVVRAFCPLVTDVPLTPALYEWVAVDGQEYFFGGCRVLRDDNGKTGRVDFGDSIVGGDLDPNELLNLVYSVVFTANALDNELRDKFGGTLFGRE